jgi:putative flippase GtrA
MRSPEPDGPSVLGPSGEAGRAGHEPADTLVGMSAPPQSSLAPATVETPSLVPKLVRYFTGSLVATGCSEVAFVLLYGPLGMGTAWSSVLSWLAGAIPNFWLNRNWAWQRTGRPSLRREVAPYAAVVVVTLLLATLLTHLADRLLHHEGVASSLRVTLVAAVFLGTYVVVFAVRFFLLEQLFTRLHVHESRQQER